MAMTDHEREYYAKAKAAGFDDALIAERIKARRGSGAPSYKLTDYAGEAEKLPSQVPQYEREAADLERRGLSGSQVAESLTNTAHLSTRSATDAARAEDPVANDPLAAMVLAGTLGAGAGALAAPLGPVISGAVNGATQSATLGGRGKDIAIGAATGAAIPALGAVAKKIGSKITGSEGGQARALWEKHGGNVGPLDSGSGVDEVAGLEPTRANVGKASAIGARNIREGLEADFEKRTGEPYRAARAAVEEAPPVPEEVVDVPTRQTPRESMATVVENDLGGSRARGTSDLRIVEPGRIPAEKMRDISPLRGAIADQLYAESTPTTVRPFLRAELDRLDALRGEDGRVMVTEKRLNDMRQRLSDMADYGVNTGAGTGSLKDRSFKAVASAAKELVDQGPYAEPNAIYSKGMRSLGEDRKALGLKRSPSKTETGVTTEDAKLAQILRNRGNDSEAAGAMVERTDVPAFVARHPELARQVDLPDLVRAKGKLQFSLGGGDPTANLIQATAQAGRGIGHRLLDLGLHNASAAAGRLAYRPGQALNFAGQQLQAPAINQIMAAYAAQQELERQRAESLGR